MIKNYYFEEILNCEMCGDNTKAHMILGIRLNQSQGLSPKKKSGIGVTVKKCRNCGLIYSSPQPIPSTIQDHYGVPPETYWKPEYFQVDNKYFLREIEESKELLNHMENIKALDVGAGLGKGMIAMEKQGFEVYGFEPSESFYSKAISSMNISREKLRLGAIEEIGYQQEAFDFITFGAVLEHLYHPSTALEKAMKWLRPNGIIHIEVPSSKWLIATLVNFYYGLIGTNYVTHLSPMHVPFHLYEFTLDSFKSLKTKLGFEVVKYRYDVCEIPFIPGAFHGFFRWLMKNTNSGMQLTVYLRKK